MNAGEVDFGADTEQVCAAFTVVPGVGEWTAQYTALRALGEPDAFPASDLVLRRMASVNGSPLTPSGLQDKAKAWRPWRAYAAMHLWRAANVTKSSTDQAANRKRISLDPKISCGSPPFFT